MITPPVGWCKRHWVQCLILTSVVAFAGRADTLWSASSDTNAAGILAAISRTKGAQANEPAIPAKKRKLTRSDPAWQDIQDALKILDRAGEGWVRECVEEMMDDNNITLDPNLDATGKYEGVSWAGEELNIEPSELPSAQKRRGSSDPTMKIGTLLEDQARSYRRLLQLVGTLFHECSHR
ncbi:hypothetical protein IIA16_02060, partial [bacterium]|nr:hypothetical protein [bacterium]